MLPQTYIKAVLAFTTTLTVMVSWSSCGSTCGEYYKKTILKGQKLRMRAIMIKREPVQEHGLILGKLAGRKTAFLNPGLGSCGITYTDNDRGACLWNGLNRKEPRTSGTTQGWLTGDNPQNCKKDIFINRGKFRAVGKVLDGCSFADGPPVTDVEGCSSIYVTKQTFKDLGGDPAVGRIEIDDWDFVNGRQNPPF
ncbi:hypothetical protein MJO29_002666 [Puccinia striiformis f. sp. tritici]|uniref:hypothetical protein n=1 Tax=Puccinia striiformis f. sp. tritici TaxID=168172 RepID=UPI002007817A|nr:hypothetical protein Pst134EA_005444 [Puccinia striiformis f. sp. tritici]XP_047811007.1 hypothetical protein Pst134EA_005446 [Puccinia striiformis f. sp. tritici]KAI9618938.1 hypothetical protein H4Q26_012195 [Puccinia striiformis f. sp. tritici PST-130]KAH9471551.1 hypothetical protein Pst134EA_005444 [Puccinia striiformis f. sp. tritici]KAH9471553.1 hypothetical protein Pst134EA_005446 [Puccinia striiformis f. sp. tritici]KAI7964568.1 hypothetical protein MJO29_002666 [Puccinia striiform